MALPPTENILKPHKNTKTSEQNKNGCFKLLCLELGVLLMVKKTGEVLTNDRGLKNNIKREEWQQSTRQTESKEEKDDRWLGLKIQLHASKCISFLFLTYFSD